MILRTLLTLLAIGGALGAASAEECTVFRLDGPDAAKAVADSERRRDGWPLQGQQSHIANG